MFSKNKHYYSFQIKREKNFMEMYEDAKQFDHLTITPPLQLLAMGNMGPRLVFLREGTVEYFKC